MAVVPVQGMPIAFRQAITLEQYAGFIEYDECAFFGVVGPNYQASQCRDIWSFRERQNVARYLAEAQEEIEDEVSYFLSPTWVVGKVEDELNFNERYVDSRFPARVYNTRWNKIIDIGERASSDVALGETINQATDPAVIGPVATTVTVVEEIHVYYVNSNIEINPSKITISGGFVTIEVPRCRTVALDLQDNPSEGYDYNDLSNFATEVDIKRIYNNTSGKQGVLTCASSCDCTCTTSETEICTTVLNNRLGSIELDRTAWSCCSDCTRNIKAGLYYYCGDISLSLKAQESIIRLAHSKMPSEPCGCDLVHDLWRRDQKIPEIMTRERAMCPFGINDGAWVAWQWAKTMKHYRLPYL